MFAGVDASVVNDRLANMSNLSALPRGISPDKDGHLQPGQHSEIRSYHQARSCCVDTRVVNDLLTDRMPSKIPDPVANLVQIIKHLEAYSSEPHYEAIK